MTPSALFEKSKIFVSGGSVVAKLKPKGIDGRAPAGTGACVLIDSAREKLTRSRYSKDGQIDSSVVCWWSDWSG